MRLKFSGASDKTIEFVMGVLPMLGNIREFEVYNAPDQTRFHTVEDGYPCSFRFVLRDDRGTELWLNTNCGYGGSGPHATGVILQILGLHDNYGVEEKPAIKATNLQPVHRLNLLVAMHGAPLQLRGLFWACMLFRTAHLLQSARTALRCLGSLHSAEGRRDVRVPEELIGQRGQVEFAGHTTNQLMGLHLPLPEQLDVEQVQSIVRLVAEEFGGEIVIRDYEV